MSISRLFTFLLAIVAVVAITPQGLYPVSNRRSPRPVPRGWSLRRRADPDVILPLKFSLVQSNLENLERYILDVSDPLSPNYGKHWSPAKVTDTFRPSTESVDTVRSWLAHEHGIALQNVQLSRNRDALHLNVTVAEAESILGAEYFVYRHSEDGSERVGCHHGYHLPEHVSKHVDIVWPTVHLGNPSLSRRDSSVGTGFSSAQRPGGVPLMPLSEAKLPSDATDCGAGVTLDCLRELYDFHYETVGLDKNAFAVAEFGNNIFRPADLDTFFQKYSPAQVGTQPAVISVEGGTINGTGSLGESSLDIELAMGLLGPRQQVHVYQVGETNGDQDPTDEILAALDGSFCSAEGVSEQGLTDCGSALHTKVISLSYHFNPDILDPNITPVVQRQCTEIGKLTLTGMTFVASSGDGGVAYSQSHLCLVSNGTLVSGNPAGAFVGQLPASCPFVTAVGATSVTPGNSVKDPETATTRFPSGAGFSNNFPRPAWQDAAVSNYLRHFAPDYAPDVFNRSGRAYPDVAANGFPTVIAENGGFVLTGGTSASAPIFASIIAAVNDARRVLGKGPVGFINPAIYSPLFARAFNDITNGTNPGCQTEGFVASPGWDPVGGLGTPNFPRLLAAFLLLP